jgi:hypothetical protein
MPLKAHEHPLKKIFSADFDFAIPHYQRPYAWGTDRPYSSLTTSRLPLAGTRRSRTSSDLSSSSSRTRTRRVRTLSTVNSV